MKNIENLVQSARGENLEQFEKELHHFRMAVSSIGNTSYSHSTAEKSWMFICGCLSSRFDDLRTVAKTYWKLQTQDGLRSKDCRKNIFTDFSCVLMACDKSNICLIIEDFIHQVQSSIQETDHFINSLNNTLSQWVSHQKWEGEHVLSKMIQTYNLNLDNLLYRAVRVPNVGLIEYMIHTADQSTKEEYASYVAGNWAQRIVEQYRPEEISSKFKELAPLFCAVKTHFNMDAFIDCGLIDTLIENTVDIGTIRWAIERAAKWDGVSQAPLGSPSVFRQFNVLLNHIDLPSTTKHMDTLQKMHQLCPEELPRLQEWFNFMEKQRLLQHVNLPNGLGKKKM